MIGFINKIIRNIKFLPTLYQHREVVRNLLKSENLHFIEYIFPGHFYSPIPDKQEIKLRSKTIFDRSQAELPAIDLNIKSQIQLLKNFSAYYDEMPFPETNSKQWRYFLDNTYFSFGDGIVLYSFLRHFSPQRLIEVGSGFSSSAMLDINDTFFQNKMDLTFIEPYPERLFRLLSEEDKQAVSIEVKSVQDVDLDVFRSLEQNDILFIDSSHVAKIGSDVCHLLFNILPQLKPGVIIHFHDILYPFEYPEYWLEQGRAWNEAYFLRAFLQDNSAFEILYFNSYMAEHHRDLITQSLPHVLKSPSDQTVPGNTSLWIQKVQ